MDQKPPLGNSNANPYTNPDPIPSTNTGPAQTPTIDPFAPPVSQQPALPQTPIPAVASVVGVPKRSNRQIVLVAAAGLLVVIAGAAGVYVWQHSKSSDNKRTASATRQDASSSDEGTTENDTSYHPSLLGGRQAKARDTKRMTDINAMDAHLEAYYAMYGNYPSLTQMNTASWRADYLAGLDTSSLIDPSSSSSSAATAKLVTKPTAKAYAYTVTAENGDSCEDDPTQCWRFTLTATLETTVDGATTYIKQSF